MGLQNIVPGGLGVTIFFVISGYIITNLLLRENKLFGNVKVGLFYRRRFWKIFPPLFFLVLIPNVVLWKIYEVSLFKFVSLSFFFFNWAQISGDSRDFFPPSGVTWSLAIEEQFYIVIAILVFLFQKYFTKQDNLALFLTVVYSIVFVLSTFLRVIISFQKQLPGAYGETGNLPRIYNGTDTRMSSICAGALLAILFQNESAQRFLSNHLRDHKSMCFTAIFFLLIFSLTVREIHFRDTFRYTFQELAICLLIASGPVLNLWPRFVQRVTSSSYVQLIGLSSYSLYLSHPIVILVMDNYFDAQSLHLNIYAWRIFGFLICVVLGVAAHKLFDSPFESKRQAARRI
jgi:peptidoglycan/LPS O-acetylase OafA/YrhL